MSPTEQMREALTTIMRMADAAKEPCCPDPESPAAIRNGKFASIAMVAAQGLGWVRGPALTAPAAEVPEAMGDAEIDRLLPESDGTAEANATRVELAPGVWGSEYEEVDAWSRPLIRQFASALNAARDAQWQSTRLRGGVPDVDDLAQFIRQIDGNHRMGAGALAEHICEWLTAAPQAPAAAMDADGEAFRTAARLGLTLRFHGGCAQSGMPGSPSAYEVVTGADPASSMRQAVRQAAAVIEAGGEPQRLNTAPAVDAGVVRDGWSVSAYKVGTLTVQSMSQLDGRTLWKIADGFGNVLNKQGEWEWEPMPSSRDDEFLARCRYATLDDVLAAMSAQAGKGGAA